MILLAAAAGTFAASVGFAGPWTPAARAAAGPTITNVGLVGPAAAGENTPVTSGSWNTPWDQDGYISGTTSGGVGYGCPGTTLANGFEGWSYLVPDSPGVLNTLTFASGQGPTTPANGLPLLQASDGGPYATPIDVVPAFDDQTAFDFSTYHDQGGWATTPTTGFLYPGTWDLGMACTDSSNAVTTLFNTQITITSAPTASDPNNFTWAVALATPTTTTLTASPSNTAQAGTPVVMTASVSPSSATGQVTFMDGSQSLGTATLSGGTASMSTTKLGNGNHSLTAVYGGTGSSTSGFEASTSKEVAYNITAASSSSTTQPGSGSTTTTTTPSGTGSTTTTVAGGGGVNGSTTTTTGSGTGGSGGSGSLGGGTGGAFGSTGVGSTGTGSGVVPGGTGSDPAVLATTGASIVAQLGFAAGLVALGLFVLSFSVAPGRRRSHEVTDHQ